MGRRRDNSARRYFVNASSSIFSTLISMTILVWVNNFLLKRVSPEEYALVPIVMSLMIVLEFFKITFTRGISRGMVEADARGDDFGVTKIVSSMIPVLGFVASVLGLGGAIAVIFIDSVIQVDPEYLDIARVMLGVLVLDLCLNMATAPMTAGLYVQMRFLELNLLILAKEALRGVLLVSLLFFAGPSAVWVPVSAATAGLALTLSLFVITWRILPSARFKFAMVDMATIRNLLSFSLWTSVQGINMFAQQAAPALFLNRFGTSIDVAAFHVGNLPNLQIRKLTQAAANPATPALTALYATEGESILQDFYYRGGRYHLWGALFLLPPLLVFAKPLIELYAGRIYLDAAIVMILVLVAYPFNYAGAMFYQIAFATGRIKSYNVCSVGMAIITLISLYIFTSILDWGAIGAGFAMFLGFGLSQIFIIWPFGLKMVRGKWLPFINQVLVPGLIPTAAALLSCWIYGRVQVVDSWTALGVGCMLSAVIYVGALVICCRDPKDQQLLQRAIQKVISNFKS